MFLQPIIYLMPFTFMACCGYKKLEKYTELKKNTVGGAAFQWAPDEEVIVKGIEANQKIIFDKMYFKLGDSDRFETGDGRLICTSFPEHPQTYNRLSVRVVGHGYNGEEVELDDFVVNECNQDKLRNMFDVSRIGTNKYTLTFKDKKNRCFKREIEVIEFELTLTVHREKPVEKKCTDLNDSQKTQDGSVVPNSWMDNGDTFDKQSLLGSKFKIMRNTKKELKKSIYGTCASVKLDDQKFHVVDVFYKGIPIDRVVSKSCSPFADHSMYMEDVKSVSQEEIYVNYLNMENNCLRRKYEVRMQPVAGDDILRRVTVKRQFVPSDGKKYCKKMKFSCRLYKFYYDVELEEKQDLS